MLLSVVISKNTEEKVPSVLITREIDQTADTVSSRQSTALLDLTASKVSIGSEI